VVSTIKKDMTIEELNRHNGEIEKTVFLAVKGVIYDVSSSDFYAVGGGYHHFAGHDASVGLAKMSFDVNHLDRDNDYELSETEKTTLNDWIKKFNLKYPIVG